MDHLADHLTRFSVVRIRLHILTKLLIRLDEPVGCKDDVEGEESATVRNVTLVAVTMADSLASSAAEG